jgi:hypothetical protein
MTAGRCEKAHQRQTVTRSITRADDCCRCALGKPVKRWYEVEKRWLTGSTMDDSHLFSRLITVYRQPPLGVNSESGGAKREKRWLAFIEVRVSHLFFRHEVGKRWLYIRWTDSHLFFRHEVKRWLTRTTMNDSHLFFRVNPWRGGRGRKNRMAAAMRKEVAVCPSDVQPPLPLRASPTSCEKRGTKWKRWLAFIEVRVSHEKRGGCHS